MRHPIVLSSINDSTILRYSEQPSRYQSLLFLACMERFRPVEKLTAYKLPLKISVPPDAALQAYFMSPWDEELMRSWTQGSGLRLEQLAGCFGAVYSAQVTNDFSSQQDLKWKRMQSFLWVCSWKTTSNGAIELMGWFVKSFHRRGAVCSAITTCFRVSGTHEALPSGNTV